MNLRIPGLALVACLSLTACGGGEGQAPSPVTPPPAPAPAPPPPPPVAPEGIHREWKFLVDPYGPGAPQILGDEGSQTGFGIVNDERIVGGFHVKPADVPDGARLTVYSDDRGENYWVGAQAPAQRFDDPTRLLGVGSSLGQYQFFRKNSDDATLSFTVNEAVIELIDRGADQMPRPPTPEECDYSGLQPGLCHSVVSGQLSLDVRIFNASAEEDVLYVSGFAHFCGWQQHWCDGLPVTPVAGAEIALWDETDFAVDRDVGGLGLGDHARLRLREPVTIEVPLDSVETGEIFVVQTKAAAWAYDVRHRDTYASAFLRDPLTIGGVGMQFTGLTVVDDPHVTLPPYEVPAAPACNGAPDPAAGTLQFAADTFEVLESGREAAVHVTRTGGTLGRVSASFITEDDTAHDGTDYASVRGNVAFADGQGGTRRIVVPLIDNDDQDGERVVTLRLTAPRGCAQLGAADEAAIIIYDDEAPPPPTYTVYVNVTGLAGEGLLIEDVVTGANIAPQSNGTQALGYLYDAGMSYDVRVHSQPHSPDQVCSVSDGTGSISNSDVHIEVSCETHQPTGELDPAFGAGGKVYVSDLEGARAVVVQGTGRIVVLTETMLAAFHADGSADTSFGNGGRVLISFTGGAGEEAYGLSIQPDDKLIVTGRARTGTRYDMAVMRFDANGAVDTAFGTGGLTTFNPHSNFQPGDGTVGSHYGEKALVTADGHIYVAGLATYRDPTGDNHLNFAAARVNPDGTPDSGFGAGRGTYASVTNNGDVAHALGVQSDGKLVLAGAANDSGGAGFARFKTNGLLDTDNPRTPENYGRDGAGTVYIDQAPQGIMGRVNDLVMMEDDSLVVNAALIVPHATLGYVAQVMLVKVSSDGTAGASGDYVHTPLGPDNDIGSQLIRTPDGKFLLAAQVSSASTVADFGVVRYNADLTLDESFGVNGVMLVDFYGSRDGAQALALAPDGGIIVVGTARNGSSERLAMMRIAP